jgi:hypothetical protein
MQIIVSPVSNGDNFLLDVEQEAPIKFVREQIAARVGTQPGNVKVRLSEPLRPHTALPVRPLRARLLLVREAVHIRYGVVASGSALRARLRPPLTTSFRRAPFLGN